MRIEKLEKKMIASADYIRECLEEELAWAEQRTREVQRGLDRLRAPSPQDESAEPAEELASVVESVREELEEELAWLEQGKSELHRGIYHLTASFSQATLAHQAESARRLEHPPPSPPARDRDAPVIEVPWNSMLPYNDSDEDSHSTPSSQYD